MKVALCLSGHFRTFNECWPSLKVNLLDRYDVDIFASAWIDSTGDFYPIEWVEDTYNNNGYAPGTQPVTTEYIQTVIEKLKPKDIHLDHYWLHEDRFAQIVKDVYRYRPGTDFKHKPKVPLSMNWQRYVAVKLKQQAEVRQGWKYDIAISTRYDIEYTKPMILEELDLNLLTVPNRFTHVGTDDIWGVGPNHVIDTWADQINHIEALAVRNDFYLQVHQWLFQWLEFNNIKWQDSGNLGIGIRRKDWIQF